MRATRSLYVDRTAENRSRQRSSTDTFQKKDTEHRGGIVSESLSSFRSPKKSSSSRLSLQIGNSHQRTDSTGSRDSSTFSVGRDSVGQREAIQAIGGVPRGSSSSDKAAKQAQKDRIQVSIRSRPMNAREHGMTCVWRFGDTFLEELNDDGVTSAGTRHTYDHVFSPEVGTAEVYEKQCKQIVAGSMEGYNGTIFAYGQTSSGKTHTLTGNPNGNPGVSLLAFDDVFSTVRGQGNEWKIMVSFLQIYNESVTDLLQTDPVAGKNMRIYEDKIYGPRVQGATELHVESPKGCLDVLLRGEKMRNYAKTEMNDASSRSHTIFQMRIESKAVVVSAQEESSKDMHDVAVLFQETQRYLMAERATLYFVDRVVQELQSMAGEIIISLPISQGLAGACATTAEAIVIEDVYQDPRFNSDNDKKTGFRSKSMCIVPIKSDDTVIGVTQFINKSDGATFSPIDKERAEEFAAKAAPHLAAAQARASLASSGMLNLVDLAGSERVKKTGSSGTVLAEAGYINKSLMTLGACILALSECKTGHIPFRDSKLTMLLASSLGGNARTSIICTISPASWNRSETVSTLQFANRAKKIVNKVQQNVRRDQSEVLGQYLVEVEKLKGEVRHAHVVYKWQIAGLKAAMSVQKKPHPFEMTQDFLDKLAQLEGEVAEMEKLTNANTLPDVPRVILRASVVANFSNISDVKRAVQVERVCSSPGGEALPVQWISEEELHTQLVCLQKLQARDAGTGSSGSEMVSVDAWPPKITNIDGSLREPLSPTRSAEELVTISREDLGNIRKRLVDLRDVTHKAEEQLAQEQEANRRLCDDSKDKDARIRELEWQVQALQAAGVSESRQSNNGPSTRVSEHALNQIENRLARERQELISNSMVACNLLCSLEAVRRNLGGQPQ